MSRRREPEWWARAREMRARGRSLAVIARTLRRSRSGVHYALRDDYRARKAAAELRRYHERRREP